MQKDRTQAVMILESALHKENHKPSIILELKKTVQKIIRLFISDKAQSVYELSLSYLPKDMAMAIQKMNEASSLEPDNLLIQAQTIRFMLNKKDCGGALNYAIRNNLKRWLEIDPEVELIFAQIDVCDNKYAAVKAFFSQKDYKKNPFLKQWTLLEVLRTIEERNFSRAKELLTDLFKNFPDDIEAHYFDWKLNLISESKSKSSGSKYLLSCKSLNSQKVRENIYDPWLCTRTNEIEKSSVN